MTPHKPELSCLTASLSDPERAVRERYEPILLRDWPCLQNIRSLGVAENKAPTSLFSGNDVDVYLVVVGGGVVGPLKYLSERPPIE